jgi:hypothetical protein
MKRPEDRRTEEPWTSDQLVRSTWQRLVGVGQVFLQSMGSLNERPGSRYLSKGFRERLSVACDERTWAIGRNDSTRLKSPKSPERPERHVTGIRNQCRQSTNYLSRLNN